MASLSDQWSDTTFRLAKPFKRFPRIRVSFGVLLAVLVALGTLGGSLAVGALLFTAIQSGNEVLARDLQSATNENLVGGLHALVATPVGNLGSLAILLEQESRTRRDYVSHSNAQMIRLLFAHSLAMFDGVFMGLPDGRVVGFRGSAAVPLQALVPDLLANGTLNVAVYAADGNRSGLPIGEPIQLLQDFATLKTVWYVAALQQAADRDVAVTGIRVLASCCCLGVTLSRRVHLQDELLGVIATNIRMDTISDGLNATQIGIGGEAFLVDQDGFVVGVSNQRRLNFSFAQRTHYENVSDPLFSDAVQYAMVGNSHFVLDRHLDTVVTELAGRQYLLTTFPIEYSSEFNLTAFVLIPRDDYFAVSDVAVQQALIIGAAIVLLVLVVTIVTSLVLLNIPLRRLAFGMNKVAETLAAPPLPRTSFVSEVDAMERAYGNMAAGLYGFSKYVPGPVVQELLQGVRNPQVGVSSRLCTFFFSDIVGFTSISERVSACDLNAILSEYFEAMERILHELHGITTDFLGDGIFVFWNAPSFNEQHALLACEAALRQQDKLKELSGDWRSRGLPQMAIRVGINTGMCLVGNFGSSNHLKYTVMGDAVNVASRLEQLNKVYGTGTLVGHDTYEMVKSSFVCRVVDVATLRGKSEQTRVYELLCRAGEATPQQLQLQHLSDAMLSALAHKHPEHAIALADQILLLCPEDRPARLFRKHCQEVMGGGGGT